MMTPTREPDRQCSRCRTPLITDMEILRDAQRQGFTLDFIPLRCRNGHTARVETPRPHVRFAPVCQGCHQPVLDRGRRGKQLLNHPACARVFNYQAAPAPHRYVEVAVEMSP